MVEGAPADPENTTAAGGAPAGDTAAADPEETASSAGAFPGQASPPARASSSVKTVRAVRGALTVLEELARAQPVGVTELARLTGLDKSAVQRILATLREAGWIQPAASAATSWELSARVYLIFRDRRSEALVARAEPVLRRLRDATGETAMFVLLEGETLVAVATAESPRPVRMALKRLGLHLPIVGSSGGRAVLSRASEEMVRRILGDSPDPRELREIAFARSRGWARSRGEVIEEANTVAAAVVDVAGAPLGAVVIAAPAYRLAGEQLEAAGELVRAAAEELSPSAAVERTA